MNLAEIVNENAIITRLEANERDAVVSELVDALVAAGAIEASLRDDLIERALEREERGSTGFGRGVAVPHVKHPKAPGITAAIGLSQQGVDFNSLDKQPVFSIFLLVSPADDPDGHLRAMEVIFKSLKHETFRRFLRQATTVDEVRTLLQERDNQQLT